MRLVVGRGDSFDLRGNACRRASTNSIVCPSDVRRALDRIDIRFGNGDDRLITRGDVVGGVNARFFVEAARGADDIQGGPRADTINVGEGRRDADFDREGDDTARGGAGNDTLRQSFPPSANRDVFAGAELDGGPGNDTITAFSGDPEGGGEFMFDNALRGDDGDDTIVGGAGKDFLRGGAGDDTLNGGDGPDFAVPGLGEDSVAMGRGDDDILAVDDRVGLSARNADGPDRYDGGLGSDDRVTYRLRATRVELSPNDQTANDGAPGERDQIIGIEHTEGGEANDFIFGVVSLNDGFDDEMDGGEGDDTLLSGDGDDILVGGAGVDTLRGGSGNDTRLAADGTADATISCDSGNDRADIDLRDPDPVNCERVFRADRREQPSIEVMSRRLKRSNGQVFVPLRCPKVAKSGCRGTLTLTLPGPDRRGRYSLRRGDRAQVLTRGAGRARPGTGTLVARQRGKHGPKTTTVAVRVR